MRKEWNEAKAYKVVGIIEMIVSTILTCLFIVLIVTNKEISDSYSLYTSISLVLLFGTVTFVSGFGFLFMKPRIDEKGNNNTNISGRQKK